MKSLKNQEETAPSISQNVGKASRPKVAVKKVGKASGASRSKTTKKTAAGAPAETETPKRKTAAKKNVDAKTVVKNAIKFDKKITDKLKKIVANYTEYPELLNNIERDTTKSFIDELNIDSVDFVEIIVDVEQEFDITIEDDEIYDLKSFEDLYSAIETKIKKAKK